MLEPLVKILKEKHGEDLNFKEGHVYYLFFKDGLFSVYLDEETKTLKVEIEALPEGATFIYHSDESLMKYISE